MEYIKLHQRATVAELCQHTGATKANIRYHLRMLVDQRLLAQDPGSAGPVKGRGRPVQCYKLSTAQVENNVAGLCAALLKFISATGQESSQPHILFPAIARLMVGEIKLSTSLTLQLNLAVEILNQLTYRARWEAGPNGPRVAFHHCPYADLLPEHPELCRLDQSILEYILHHHTEQIVQMNIPPHYKKSCVFSVRQSLVKP